MFGGIVGRTLMAAYGWGKGNVVRTYEQSGIHVGAPASRSAHCSQNLLVDRGVAKISGAQHIEIVGCRQSLKVMRSLCEEALWTWDALTKLVVCCNFCSRYLLFFFPSHWFSWLPPTRFRKLYQLWSLGTINRKGDGDAWKGAGVWCQWTGTNCSSAALKNSHHGCTQISKWLPCFWRLNVTGNSPMAMRWMAVTFTSFKHRIGMRKNPMCFAGRLLIWRRQNPVDGREIACFSRLRTRLPPRLGERLNQWQVIG